MNTLQAKKMSVTDDDTDRKRSLTMRVPFYIYLVQNSKNFIKNT